MTAVVVCLSFGRRNISDGLKQSMMIEPRDPFERCQLDGLLGFPGAASVNDFGLVKAVDGLGERVVVAWLSKSLGGGIFGAAMFRNRAPG